MAAKVIIVCDKKDLSKFVSETIARLKYQRYRSISKRNTIFCGDVSCTTYKINWANNAKIYLFIVSDHPADIIHQIVQNCRRCLEKLSIVVLNFDPETQYAFNSENCPIGILVRRCSKDVFAKELQEIRRELNERCK